MTLRSPLRGWPVWQLPRWLAAYVTAVIVAYAAATAGALTSTPVRPGDLRLCAVFVGCGAASVELTRRAGEREGLTRDVYVIWDLPAALLLPPLYALVIPLPRVVLTEWRIRRTLLHRRAYSTAAYRPVLRGGLAGLQVRPARPVRRRRRIGRPCPVLDHARCRVRAGKHGRPGLPDPAPGQGHRGSRHPAAQPGPRPGGGLQPGHRAVPGSADRVRSRAQRPRPGGGVAPGDRAAAIGAPRLTGRRGPDRRQDRAAERRRLAARGRRGGHRARAQTPLAVAIADIDHFKAVNDTHGHLAGDIVLAAVSAAMRDLLRDCDLCGRFGGEEFALLLPSTTAAQALEITERIRQGISQLAIPRDGTAAIRVTISIGVAVPSQARRTLDDLLAAADHALYQAKHSGRDRVVIYADTRVPAQAARPLPLARTDVLLG